MIRYQLHCDQGDGFEAWFRSSADYDSQAAEGQIVCPHCGSTAVEKAPMAPAVRTSRGREQRAERAQVMAMAAKVREHIRDNFDYVGERFAEEARKIHSGEIADRPIWGEAAPEEARALIEEGAPVAPLPPGFAPTPPRKLN